MSIAGHLAAGVRVARYGRVSVPIAAGVRVALYGCVSVLIAASALALARTASAAGFPGLGSSNLGAPLVAPASGGSGAALDWGSGADGQLGDGAQAGSDVPEPVTGLSQATAVSGGQAFSLALLADGTVAAWGHNESGELGDGGEADSDVPVPVSGLSEVAAVSAGWYHSLALLSNGTVEAWGYDGFGELGDGSEEGSSDLPVTVKKLSGVTAISAAFHSNLALLNDGEVEAWGYNEGGELGIGTKRNADVPAAVRGLSEVSAVSAGAGYNLALLKNGTVMAWGVNFAGQLGDGTTTSSETPVAMSDLSEVKAIAAGWHDSVALLNNGTVMAWGSNAAGQLGDGSSSGPETCIGEGGREFGCSRVPVAVSNLGEVSTISSGVEFAMALLDDGTVMAWGQNTEGELGDRSMLDSDVPVPVTGLRGATAIAAELEHGLAVAEPPAAPPPTLTKVQPVYGSPAGGTRVTITGTNFSDVSEVTFGSTHAASFKVESETEITAVSPPGTGIVDIGVAALGGLSPTSPADHFSYSAAVTKVKPNQGPAAGGKSVTISGTNFTGATGVSFGSTQAMSFKVESDTKITAISPPGRGRVDVTVTTAGGTSPADAADAFKYVPPRTAPPLSWASPFRPDEQPPFQSRTEIKAVSCPSTGLCAAVDALGDVLTSTEPAGGTATWIAVHGLAPYEGLSAISCPSSSLCVAVGGNAVVTSTDPSGGAGAWTRASLAPPSRRLSLMDVSCATDTMCVAVDRRGDVFTSTDPSDGRLAWHASAIYHGELQSVSCPSSDLCLAVGSGTAGSELLLSADPASVPSTWSATKVTSHELLAVSCASQVLCVMTDNYGEVLSSTDPMGGAGTWSAATVSKAPIAHVSCSAQQLCVATNGAEVIMSTNPAGGAQEWSATAIEIPNKYGGSETLEGASCPAIGLCVVTETGSGVVTSTEPESGPEAWRVTALEVGSSSFTGVSCGSLKLCAAVDAEGDVVSSTNPGGGANTWTSAHVDARALDGVSCTSTGLCVAVDEAGRILTSADPGGGPGTWRSVKVDGTTRLDGVSCASPKLCVAIDSQGHVLSSTKPTGGPRAWHRVSVARTALEGVSCPSQSLCVVTDQGNAVTSTDPAGAARSWTAQYVGVLPSISCPSTTLCVSTGLQAYDVMTSSDPTGGSSSWSSTYLGGEQEFPSLNGFDDVSCADGGFCVATTLAGNGSPGNVMISSAPLAGAEAWIEGNVYNVRLEPPNPMFELYSPDLTGVSCAPEGICVVVDTRGEVLVGTAQRSLRP